MATPNTNWVYDTPDYRQRVIELSKKLKPIESKKNSKNTTPESSENVDFKESGMNIEITKINLPEEAASKIAAIINDLEIFPDADGDFSQRYEVWFADSVRICNETKEITVDMTGALAGKITNDSIGDEPEYSKIAERYIVYGDLRCCINGAEIEFNSDEIYELIEKKVNV